MSSRLLPLCASLVIGLFVGGLVGRWTAPSVPAGQAVPPIPAQRAPDSERDEISALAKHMQNAIASEAGQGLAAVGEILNAASVSDLLDWGSAPENVARRIINEMSDDELITTITSMTTITGEELEGISDLRDYANRLSHIAMSGVITPDITDTFGSDSVDVEFSTKANKSTGAADPSSEFYDDTNRIYAVIPNNENSGDNLMVHWYRINDPEILLFDRYRVSPADEYSYVWLKKAPGQWPAGEYRVEFFSADEYLTPIASGTYQIRKD